MGAYEEMSETCSARHWNEEVKYLEVCGLAPRHGGTHSWDAGDSHPAPVSGRSDGRGDDECNCASRGNAHSCPIHTQADFVAADLTIGRSASGPSDEELREIEVRAGLDWNLSNAHALLMAFGPLRDRALAAEAEVERLTAECTRLRNMVGTIYPCSHHEEIEWLQDVGRTVTRERDAALAREARLAVQIANLRQPLEVRAEKLTEHIDTQTWACCVGCEAARWVRAGIAITDRAALASTGEPPPIPNTQEQNIAFRKAWDKRVEEGQRPSSVGVPVADQDDE